MPIYIEDHLPVAKYNGLSSKSIAEVALTSTQITTVSTEATYAVGTIGKDTSGNKYIFLKGVASTVAGDPVFWDEAFATTRAAGTLAGPIAIAMAATVADRWGWYQIYGFGSAKVVATGGVRVYGSSVTGQLTATVVTGALVHGMSTIPGTGNTVTGSLTAVKLSFPTIDRASGSY